MNRMRVLALALAACLAACATPAPPPVDGGPPVQHRATDGQFELILATDASVYRAGAPIAPAAQVVYRGPKPLERVFHPGQLAFIDLRQLDGDATMDLVHGVPCTTSDLVAGRPNEIAFTKAGLIDDRPPFDMAFFQDPLLRLPPGRWRFTARMSVSLGDCGGAGHTLVAEVDITVVP